jgi:hypothetical protein
MWHSLASSNRPLPPVLTIRQAGPFQQPRHRGGMDLEESRGIGGRPLSLGHSPSGLSLSVKREFGAAPTHASLCADRLPSCLRSLAQHGPFELRKRSDPLHQHEPSQRVADL